MGVGRSRWCRRGDSDHVVLRKRTIVRKETLAPQKMQGSCVFASGESNKKNTIFCYMSYSKQRYVYMNSSPIRHHYFSRVCICYRNPNDYFRLLNFNP